MAGKRAQDGPRDMEAAMAMRMGRRAACLGLLAGLAGCVQGRGNVGPVPAGIGPVPTGSGLAGAVGSVMVTGRAGVPTWAPEVSDGRFRAALENALRQAGILVPGGTGTLEAEVLEFAELPGDPGTTRVVMGAAYRIRDAAGRAVADRRVRSGYTATLAEAMQGVERLRLAREGAIRQNIAALLRDLGAATGEAV